MPRALSLTAALLLVGMGVAPGRLSAQEGPPPLFSTTEPIEFTLEIDLSQIPKDRKSENPERPGRVLGVDAAGEPFELTVQVRTRGNFRLKRSTCRFPPLRLNFKKKEVAGTPFGGYDKIKLVTHCNNGDSWEQSILKEYLAYRIYGVLTEMSFGTRLARITYVDSSGSMAPIERWGFLIEPKDAVAERMGGKDMEAMGKLHPGIYDAEQATLFSLFQMLIGNTDWSVMEFHNMIPVFVDQKGYFPVPYDFDWAGMVDAPYAEPAEILNTNSVKERVYRGFCWDTPMEPIYDRILSHQEEITELIAAQEELQENEASDLDSYLGQFFRVLDSEGLRSREIESECRTW